MKKKLGKLNLSENVVDEILEVFEIHELTLQSYSKPKGKIHFRDNMQDIQAMSKTLEKKLARLSRMERQTIERECPNIYDLQCHLNRLSASCRKAQDRQVRFSRREPFMLSLTLELWELLECYKIDVTIYKDGILCKILDAFFEDKPRRFLKDESDVPDDLRGFHLVREAAKRRK